MSMKVRIPRRLKKVIKNYLRRYPKEVWYMTKHHKAYCLRLINGKLWCIYHD